MRTYLEAKESREETEGYVTATTMNNFAKKRLSRVLVISSISVIGGLFVPILWLMILNTKQSHTFFGSLPVWLVSPGYTLAAFLFPELARNESAGLTLLPQSLVINFVFYFLMSFAFCLLIIKLRDTVRNQ